MDLKRLFGVLFITVMLLSMPCAYATDDSSDNTEFIAIQEINNNIGSVFIISFIKDCSDIISLYKPVLMKSSNGYKGKIRASITSEVRKREHYEKPSVKRKKKAEAARKRKY